MHSLRDKNGTCNHLQNLLPLILCFWIAFTFSASAAQFPIFCNQVGNIRTCRWVVHGIAGSSTTCNVWRSDFDSTTGKASSSSTAGGSWNTEAECAAFHGVSFSATTSPTIFDESVVTKQQLDDFLTVLVELLKFCCFWFVVHMIDAVISMGINS